MIVYEYPFNESVRTMLRLEHLFQRLATLVARDEAVDHHTALATLFEIMDVASRTDLKGDLLQDLERQRKQLSGFRGNPAISEAALDDALSTVDAASGRLAKLPGKAGQALGSDEWLMAIRSRIGIPGGTCSFDLPSYHAWQHLPAPRRQADLQRWTGSLAPLSSALRVSLGLLRESGPAERVTATGGRWQQTLTTGRPMQLARLRIDASEGWFPEISGNRLLLAIRVMRCDDEGHVVPLPADRSFLLSLCS